MQPSLNQVSLYRARYLALVQPLVAEPVLATGVLALAGALRDTLLGAPVLDDALLPSSVLVGATAVELHCFSYSLCGRELAPRSEVARFSRAGMRAEFSTTTMTKRLEVFLADGRNLQFESMRGFDLNDELFRHLVGGLG